MMIAEEIRTLSSAEIATAIKLLLSLVNGDRVEMPPLPINTEAHVAQVKLLIDFLAMLTLKLEHHLGDVATMNKPRYSPRQQDSAQWHIAQAEEIRQAEQEAAAKEQQRAAAMAKAQKAQQDAREAAQIETLRLAGYTGPIR